MTTAIYNGYISIEEYTFSSIEEAVNYLSYYYEERLRANGLSAYLLNHALRNEDTVRVYEIPNSDYKEHFELKGLSNGAVSFVNYIYFDTPTELDEEEWQDTVNNFLSK